MTPRVSKKDMSTSSTTRQTHDAETFDYFELENYEGHPPRDEPGVIDFYSPLVFAVLGIFVLLAGFDLGIGTLQDPGTGLWPAINGALLIAMTPLVFIARHRFDPPPLKGLIRALGVAVPMLVFVPLYDWAGLIGAGSLALLVITKYVGGMRWIPSLATSVLTPVVVYVIFAELLGVNLRPF